MNIDYIGWPLDIICSISVTGNDVRSMSDDFERVLSAIDETNLAETIALQEAIIQSQMQPTVTSGINVLFHVYSLCPYDMQVCCLNVASLYFYT